MAQRVTCIEKRGDQYDPYERIAAIGGAGWSAEEDEAIATVKRDLNAYYVETAAGTVYLVVRIHLCREYLTTEANGVVPDELLALPECR